MRKNFGIFFVFIALIIAGAAVAGYAYHADFWLAPPKEKFERSWKEDIQKLQKKSQLPQQWSEIAEVKVQADNSPAQKWLPGLNIPVIKNPQGHYRLEVFIIHWIDGYRYGAVVQYNLVERTTNNTIWEMNRTYKLGVVY